MKKNKALHPLLRQTLSFSISFTLLLSCLSPTLFAQSKEDLSHSAWKKDEIIYVSLLEDGKPQAAYAVNRFEVESRQKIMDYGDYQAVKNLSSEAPLQQKGDRIETTVDPGIFFYQGDLKKLDFPWTIQLDYRLNGKSLPYHEIRHQAGKLSIDVHVQPQGKGKLYEHFHDAFLLQLNLTLRADNLELLEAEQATPSYVGSKQQLSYMIFPGKTGDFHVEARGENWHPEAVQLAAIPYAMDPGIDLPDPEEIAARFAPLHKGLAQLAQGMQQLHTGLLQAQNGASQLSGGLNELSCRGAELSDGLYQLATGLSQFSSGFSQFSTGLKQLTTELETALNGVQKIVDEIGVENLQTGLSKLDDLLEKLIKVLELPDAPNEITGGIKNILEWIRFLRRHQLLSLQQATERAEQLFTSLDSIQKQAQEALLQVQQLPQTQTSGASHAPDEALLATLQSLGGQLQTLDQQLQMDDGDHAPSLRQELSQAQAQLQNAITLAQSPTPANSAPTATTSGREQYLLQSLKNIEGLAQKALEGGRPEGKEALKSLEEQLDKIESTLQASQSPTASQRQEMAKTLRELQRELPKKTSDVIILLKKIKEACKKFTPLLSKLSEARAGLAQIDQAAAQLQNGSQQLTAGAWKAYQGFNLYWSGVGQAAGGAIRLQEGMGKMVEGVAALEAGTTRAANETANMAPQIKSQMDQWTRGLIPQAYVARSFLSEKNQNIHSVQFVMLTDIPEEEKNATQPEAAEEQLSFWQKVVRLFSKKDTK